MKNTVTYRSLVWRRSRAAYRMRLIVAMLSLATSGALMYLLYMLVTSAIGWTGAKLDDLGYGYPRTFQTDGLLATRRPAAQPVHIIVQNMQGRVWIVVLPKDNTGRVVAIKGPQWLGPGRDLVPATVTLQDVNHDGHADLLLHVGNSTFIYVQDAHQQSFVLQSDHSRGGRS
ncbi:MAG TPA: hypothetical protein VHB98_16110 [Chloroflexota bacterium]|nr:hypothetical protein [Chloroflexota bacterium]